MASRTATKEAQKRGGGWAVKSSVSRRLAASAARVPVAVHDRGRSLGGLGIFWAKIRALRPLFPPRDAKVPRAWSGPRNMRFCLAPG